MKKNNINFPHPLLKDGIADYVDCKFEINNLDDIFNSLKEENGKLILTIKYHLKCNSLQQMIANNEANVVLYLESKMTNFRKYYIFDGANNVKEIEINKEELGDYLDVKPYIVSNIDTNNFNLQEHNKEIFGDFSFSIRKGDFLAEANGIKIELNKYDPLADKPSIFKIHVDYNLNDDFVVNWEDDYISITLNEKLHGLYQKISEEPKYRIVLSSLFVVPALVDVLATMKAANGDDLEFYKDKKWYVVLTSRLKACKIDLDLEDNLSRIANKILPIVSTAVDNIDKIISEIYNDKEEK